jgi:hypothetical protein
MTPATNGPDARAAFATFWRGPLNPLAYSCLASFPAVGAGLVVYSYEDGLDLPAGVEGADARLICSDLSLLHRYIAAGKPSLAMFADMFRYKLMRETGRCWVDADVFCLRKPDFSKEAIVFGRQAEAWGKALINNAVLKLPPVHPLLIELLQRAEDAVDVDQSWGAIGPFLLTDLAEKYGIDHLARDVSDFYPIDADGFWRPLLPTYCDAVSQAVSRSTFLHLWGAMFDRSGYNVSARPLPGSFLAKLCQRLGTLDRFIGAHDERALSIALAEWIERDEATPRSAPAAS